MGIRGLIDTGAILALLDRDDRWHSACVEAFPLFHLPLATSAAVLTELFHLVGDNRREIDAAWSFLRSGAVTVLSIDDADMPILDLLMKKYHDRPMDFADATLVHLARRESLHTIFTVDFDDFETYRINGRRRFRIFPTR
ncbi:MAG: type II toxin-antitoxin system VapC family toxin [Candidatus Binatia bacterium]